VDGTPVKVLPLGDCQHSFQRPDEFHEDGITSSGIRLYAVYASSPESFPPGKYFIILLRKPVSNGTPSESAFALSMNDEGITGYQNGCDETPQHMVASQHLTKAIVAPIVEQ
jgi:hypothetical protein